MILLVNSKKGLASRSKVCASVLFSLALSASILSGTGAIAGNITIVSPKNAEKIYTFSSSTEIEVVCRIDNIVRLFVNGISVPVPMGRKLKLPLTFDGAGRKEISVVATDSRGKLITEYRSFMLVRTYPDIRNHWAHQEVEYLSTLGYMTGKYGSLLFMPDAPVSRAELAQILTQIRSVTLGVPTGSVALDVAAHYWATPYISAAIDNRMMALTREGYFYPEAMVTRADAVVAISKAFHIPLQSAQQKFLPDLSDQYWARDAIYTAMVDGMLPRDWDLQQGFFPGYLVTRGELAALLARSPVIRNEISALERQTVSFPSSYHTQHEQTTVVNASGKDGYIRLTEDRVSANRVQKTVISFNTNLAPFAGKVKKMEIDLTAVGRLANTAMLDDGLWGDLYSRDGVFTVELIPSAGISAGDKRLPIQVVDVHGNTYEEEALLTIVTPQARVVTVAEPQPQIVPVQPIAEVPVKVHQVVTINEPAPAAIASLQAVAVTASGQATTPAAQEGQQREPVTYVVQPGDTLLVVSVRTTGSPYHWKAIAVHNSIPVEERYIDGELSYYSYIEVGQILTIPPEVLP